MVLYPDEHLLRAVDIICHPLSSLSSSLQVSYGAESKETKEWRSCLIKSESDGRKRSWRETLGIKLNYPFGNCSRAKVKRANREVSFYFASGSLCIVIWDKPLLSEHIIFVITGRLSSTLAVLGLLIKFWNNQETLGHRRNVITLHTGLAQPTCYHSLQHQLFPGPFH